jgi:hypothetical protein
LLKGVVSSVVVLGGEKGKDGGEVNGVGGDDEGEVMVRRFRKAIEQEIAEAEEELVEIGEEAVGVMKDIEKVSWERGLRSEWPVANQGAGL